MAITTINNRAINRADTAAAGQRWTATSATASDFQVGGAWNFIATQTASTSSLIEFDTDEMTSTYDCYKIFITNLHMSNDSANLYMQFSQSSSYITSGYRYATARVTYDGGSVVDANSSASAAFLKLTRDGTGNATGENSNFEITLWHPLGTDNGKLYHYNGCVIHDGGESRQDLGAGTYNGNQAALDAIKLYPQAGTFASGTFAIYGLSKS